MIYLANIILPLMTLFVLGYGIIKKVNVYQEFLNGVREGIRITLNIFPSIMAMVVSVSMLVKSNILRDILGVIDLGILPKEVIPIIILKPISASSSMMLLNEVLVSNGVDSDVGILASVLVGVTDTFIYISSIYFASVNIKKTKQTFFIGFLINFVSILICIWLVKYL